MYIIAVKHQIEDSELKEQTKSLAKLITKINIDFIGKVQSVNKTDKMIVKHKGAIADILLFQKEHPGILFLISPQILPYFDIDLREWLRGDETKAIPFWFSEAVGYDFYCNLFNEYRSLSFNKYGYITLIINKLIKLFSMDLQSEYYGEILNINTSKGYLAKLYDNVLNKRTKGDKDNGQKQIKEKY